MNRRLAFFFLPFLLACPAKKEPGLDLKVSLDDKSQTRRLAFGDGPQPLANQHTGAPETWSELTAKSGKTTMAMSSPALSYKGEFALLIHDKSEIDLVVLPSLEKEPPQAIRAIATQPKVLLHGVESVALFTHHTHKNSPAQLPSLEVRVPGKGRSMLSSEDLESIPLHEQPKGARRKASWIALADIVALRLPLEQVQEVHILQDGNKTSVFSGSALYDGRQALYLKPNKAGQWKFRAWELGDSPRVVEEVPSIRRLEILPRENEGKNGPNTQSPPPP